MQGPKLAVNIAMLVGSVRVIVPKGIEVELTGSPMMGARRLHVQRGRVLTDAPRVRVRVLLESERVSARRPPPRPAALTSLWSSTAETVMWRS
jgi:hypothetical protein